MKENNYILESITWYFGKANRGLSEIVNMKIPVDGESIRFYYGVYIESILSALDFMRDEQHTSFKEIDELLQQDAHEYLRELRNSIVHRGYDLAKEGTTLNDKLYLRTPRDVTNKHGKIIPYPKEDLLIQFLIKVDSIIRNFLSKKIFDLGLLELKKVTEQEKNIAFDGIINFVLNYPHMTETHKNLFLDNSVVIKESINLEEIDRVKIEKYKSVMIFDGFFSSYEGNY